MLPTEEHCDDCVPDYVKKRSHASILLSCLPFLATFILVVVVVLRKLYPLLSGSNGNGPANENHEVRLPTHNYDFKPAATRRGRFARRLVAKLSTKRVAQGVFATNIALSAVLAELILCEISNTLNPSARRLALNLTLPTLLVLLIVVAPALELRSVIAATGLSFAGTGKKRFRVAWLFEGIGLAIWLLGFWYMGHGLLGLYLRENFEIRGRKKHTFAEGCLERIGIIGISLMASLSGFAAVSALWQTFGVKDRPVTESDIARKQAGLDATQDMLSAKKSRLRALERKMSDTRNDGTFMARVIGNLRGSSDTQERSTLALEISGLETMRLSLQNSLYSLRSRRTAQLRSHTSVGRLTTAFSYGFALYCAFRLANTTLNLLRRSLFSTVSSSTDPVTHLLALIARNWDPSLNQAVWSRQISFLLSGIMLILAFNSALQTFLLLARAFPSLLSAAFGGANFALLVSQVCASYVISSALLLRSNVPSEVGGVISDTLGAPLETSKVDAWFEGWFLGAAGLTMVGIWVGRKLRGPGEWDEDTAMEEGAVELGKRS